MVDAPSKTDDYISEPFPKDKIAPLFQDDFNRSNELLTASLKWTDSVGGPTFITNQELNTTDAGGGIASTPNNPSAFPDLPKTYLETSIKMDGSERQEYWVLPYADIDNMAIVGCFYTYESGALNIYAGDFMAYQMSSLSPFISLVNYPAYATNYVGCEVDQVTGKATAYLNSVKIGMTEGLTVSSVEDSSPLMYAIGNGMIIDNVKAFPSFLEGRAPNDGDLRIYNTPFAGYYSNQLANFNLQGYCANNGATVQVKDSAPGTYQSSVATCTNNQFSILLNMSGSGRFPVGVNQIRIEYVVGGNTSEYTHYFSNIGSAPIGIVIGSPTPSRGLEGTVFAWPVIYTNASAITLTSSDVVLSGDTSGCVASITGTGSTSRTVNVTGCSSTPGTVRISLNAGTANNGGSVLAGPAGPSVAVNLVVLPTLTIGSPTPSSGSASTEFVWPVTFENAANVQLYSGYITLSGATAGCAISVTGSGNTSREVRVSGCSQIGTVALSISAGAAFSSDGDASLSVGPSASVSITNPITVNFASSFDVVDKGTTANTQQMMITLDKPSPVDFTVEYSVSSFFSTAMNPTHYNLPLSGTVVVPAGQTTWPISYTYQGSSGYIGSKSIQLGLSSAKGAGVAGFIGANQNMRRLVLDEEDGSWLAISAASSHACGVTNLGIVKCWGSNNAGQLGDGTTTDRSAPTAISGSDAYTMISAGSSDYGSYTCGVTSMGIVKCWGLNSSGQLGDGTTTNRLAPTAISGSDVYTMVSGGGQHTCGITSTGIVKCWGLNSSGQLGDGTTANRLTPTAISGSDTYTMVSAGEDYTCGITSLGIVKCWGRGESGKLGTGTYDSYVLTPTAISGSDTYMTISAGRYHTCGITTFGIAKCWGSNEAGKLGDGTSTYRYTPTSVSGVDTYTMISAGRAYYGHTCGITSLGIVKCWGNNDAGQLGDGSVWGSSTPKAISGSDTYTMLSLGTYYTCGIMSLGVVKCWGSNLWSDSTTAGSLIPTSISGSNAYTMVSAGGDQSCGITSLGIAKCWGTNYYGQLGDGANVRRTTPTAISGSDTYTMISTEGDSSSAHTCGVTSLGAVKCWGSNSSGQLGDGTTTQRLVPTEISGSDTYTMVSVGNYYSCGLTSLGVVKCWGLNSSGQLGDGTTANRLTPTAISGSDAYTMISVGHAHACGITSLGAVKCWGWNSSGQLGDGTTTNRLTPVAISGSDMYKVISAGGSPNSYTCGITSTDVVKCWGNNYYGQLGDGTTTNRLTPTAISGSDTYTMISAGGYHTCGITSLGIAKCWGKNNYGKLGDGTTTNRLTPVAISGSDTYTMVSAGKNYGTCGITDLGLLKCWGRNNSGMLGLGDTTLPIIIFTP